ncbi:hypothetical protein, conserved [Trypanosoma brucei gambiense DAL972]|uniref:C-CAP/cofactor C-like domain-containing protein n=2 Tax=Trypanosoma brucei TaxID=5691 RepID=D0A8E4_TRYB9|nr:hypothetical protein, conserved [Trypanosoma brucei gambiense DAL972]RHW67829.1 tubulin binding cofactor c [Trypanosoma brucei equiperdum]CBH17945.1 hypothetical protein, conserved [Trypanosoma brucei gambiense DAL972]|eukprot:XP_011780209.1 hypothetical protein, conserved [Trypanosoma brucei gambiense DAL972]
MEERFLRTRAEREEVRQQRAAEPSSSSAERLHFEEQAKLFEQEITQYVSSGNTGVAQERLNGFKAVVQEVSSSSILTAYDMAKSNTTLSRLQALIDSSAKSTQGPRSFKFSSASKPRPTPAAAGAATTEQPTIQCNEEPELPAGVLGNARDRTLCITPSKAVFLRGCENCLILIPPVAGSVFISDCSQCKVYVACHQLRLKNCTGSDMYVSCASTPIIECCTGMRFGPYGCWTGILHSSIGEHRYNSHEEWLKCLGEIEDLQRAGEMYKTVDDFQWLKKTPSPNWCVLAAEQWEVVAQPFVQEDAAAV